jgi:hypothetical protein
VDPTSAGTRAPALFNWLVDAARPGAGPNFQQSQPACQPTARNLERLSTTAGTMWCWSCHRRASSSILSQNAGLYSPSWHRSGHFADWSLFALASAVARSDAVGKVPIDPRLCACWPGAQNNWRWWGLLRPLAPARRAGASPQSGSAVRGSRRGGVADATRSPALARQRPAPTPNVLSNYNGSFLLVCLWV